MSSALNAIESNHQVLWAAQGRILRYGGGSVTRRGLTSRRTSGLTRYEFRCGLGVLQHNSECLRQSQNVRCLYGLGQIVRIRKRAGSRLPEANRSTTVAPFGMVTPAILISVRVVRVRKCTGGS